MAHINTKIDDEKVKKLKEICFFNGIKMRNETSCEVAYKIAVSVIDTMSDGEFERLTGYKKNK